MADFWRHVNWRRPSTFSKEKRMVLRFRLWFGRSTDSFGYTDKRGLFLHRSQTRRWYYLETNHGYYITIIEVGLLPPLTVWSSYTMCKGTMLIRYILCKPGQRLSLLSVEERAALMFPTWLSPKWLDSCFHFVYQKDGRPFCPECIAKCLVLSGR